MKSEDKRIEIICKTSFGLRKNAAYYILSYDFLTVGLYDKLMRHWIRTELGVDIPNIAEVMQKTCWGCGEEKDDLQRCMGKVNLTKYPRITMSHFLQFAKSPNIVPRNVKS